MFRKFLKWSVSETGSKTFTVLAAIGCSTGGAAYLVPQGVFLDEFVKIFQLHKDGFPAELPKSLEDKGKQVLEQTSLTPKQKAAIKFFNVYGFDVKYLGSTSTTNGAAIGIPMTFSFTRKEDVEQSDIHLEHKPISWSSEAGEELKESLLLSDSAQKFVLAREIYEASYPKLHIHGIGTTTVMLTTFQLAHWGNTKFNFRSQPFKIRAVWYGLTCVLGWALWISLTDMSNVFFDGRCDQLAADLGKDYVSGGVEFYKKKMQQNRALRTLMGQKGENDFTAHGNYYTLFRTKTMPLSQRLDNMKKLQKETEEIVQKKTTEAES